MSEILFFVLTVNFGNSTVSNKNHLGKLKHTISYVSINHGAVKALLLAVLVTCVVATASKD